MLGAGHRHGARRFQDAARVLEHILDGGADRVRVDHHEVVHVLARELEGFDAHHLDGGAIRKQADVVQLHAATGAHAAQHGVGILGLHANDLDLGPQLLDVGRNAGDQPAAADGHEDGVDRPRVLAQDLHAYRTLTGDHVGVVKGMDERQLLFFLKDLRMREGIGEALARQHDFATQAAHRVDLHLRAGGGHDDDGAAAQAAGGQRHALGVVAGRGRDHAPVQRGRRQVGHLVVGATQLETEHRLSIFALEQHRVGNSRG
ncbi:hypothetical protein D3C73_984020 [compost metagenome]